MLRAAATLALCLSFGACDAPSAGDAKPAAPAEPHVGDEPLAGGLPSLEALGEAVVAGLNDGDAAALTALAIDQAEYTGRLFPAVANHPAAEAMGRELLWDMHVRQSADDLQRALTHHGRSDLEFIRFEPRRTVRRAGVVFHERPHLVVRGADGTERELQILASLVEHESTQTFKLLGFRDHD
ncbi:hypothetical protein [Nannocystis punicea]|uniref:DUF4252 domain-containing protein n=1 Tax=Nannocystis punicea TaxID=2995304 RepID=A0ABY7H4U9_9BACT|nr:hypothetical protein [Nannocystis poenicansa]WAS93999.1 hypothetical protein O0S08_48340 [Nannocystis poenicansa]